MNNIIFLIYLLFIIIITKNSILRKKIKDFQAIYATIINSTIDYNFIVKQLLYI